MAFDNSYTAVTGATYTAAQYNTYTKGNFTAIWVYTTAGDIVYATSSTALARLGIGAAKSILGSNGSAPIWTGFGSLGFSTVYHANSTGHTYNSAVWREMPNSSKNVTVAVQSTLVCIGYVTQYATDSPNYYGFMDCYFNIDGTNITQLTTSAQYGAGIEPRTVIGYKAGVGIGTKTVRLSEYCGSGSYAVTQINYLVLVIPDG